MNGYDPGALSTACERSDRPVFLQTTRQEAPPQRVGVRLVSKLVQRALTRVSEETGVGRALPPVSPETMVERIPLVVANCLD